MSGGLHESDNRYALCPKCPYHCGFKEKGKVTLEGAKALYGFLQGNAPPCLELDSQPNVDERTAFSVIYFLQEVLRIIPDNYERCGGCGALFDVDFDTYWDEDNGHCCCYCGLLLDGEKQGAP